jgi:hypothetical protein
LVTATCSTAQLAVPSAPGVDGYGSVGSVPSDVGLNWSLVRPVQLSHTFGGQTGSGHEAAWTPKPQAVSAWSTYWWKTQSPPTP